MKAWLQLTIYNSREKKMWISVGSRTYHIPSQLFEKMFLHMNLGVRFRVTQNDINRFFIKVGTLFWGILHQ